MDCSDWSELELFKYFSYEMTLAEQAKFERHVSICSDCREEFELYFELQFHETTDEEHELIKQFLSSLQWQQQKEELARKMCQRVSGSNIVTELSSYYIPKSQLPTAVHPQLSTPLTQPTKKSSLKISASYLRALQVMVVLIIVLIQAVPIYFLLIKPYFLVNETSKKLNNTDNLSKANLAARNFERANSRLIYKPDDQEALLQRATAFEELFLFEQAQADYQHYLTLNISSHRRHEVEHRLTKLNDLLTQPGNRSLSRYDHLDSYIDDYLAARRASNLQAASSALAAATRLAEEMVSQTGDRFGEDAVRSYRNITATAIAPLIHARQQRSKIAQSTSSDNYTEYLELAYKLKEQFQQLDVQTEIELTDIQIAKFLFTTHAFAQAEVFIEINLPRTITAQHLYSQAQFLHFRGMNFNALSDYAHGKNALENSIRIAKDLNLPAFITYPLSELATMYQGSDDNQKALDIAYQAISMARQTNNQFRLIQLMQILGISAYNLNYHSLAKYYLESSKIIAHKINNAQMIAVSEMFCGLIESEQRHSNNAEEHFNLAFQAISQLADIKARQRIEFYVAGYYARAKLVAGNVATAKEFYIRALELGKAANIQGRLALSQLHQGLGTCLIAQGDLKLAEVEFTLATELAREARANSEQNNALLTFAVTRQSSEDQLRLLRKASGSASSN